MQIAGKDRRKRKQPSVSLWALDKQLRADEIERYKQNPELKMPVVISTNDCTIYWPTKFR